MLGSWNYSLNTLPQVETQNKIMFDNGALQNHQQAGNEREEMLNSIKTMLDYNPSLDTSMADDEIPEFNSEEVKNEVSKQLLNGEDLEKLKPNDNSTHIGFDQNALDYHRQNGLKNTIKQMLMNMGGGLMAL
ncbi:hypothetical protein B7982_05410 [Fibrobacter sp. UWB2]|jgi:hypothetical protein|uniref:hypothetical protein n=1 Tax=Fibrobacter sp. UWB2 TaxID=1964358 RepID=UPI000B521986|nr:hypothetical protein [Fibrobacter sp. UWB2]OWV23868.1 hypothetical protein B7982_05410 [Fibrobacter sp. UWB2]